MAKKRRKRGEFEGATCSRCQLPLDTQDGTCPNDRCPYHFGFQDEVVDDQGWPSEEEWEYIKKIRKALDKEK
jgi:hypothetical protein